MFSFGEIVVIIVVALVVLGPEKTHKLVRQVGLWAGRAKRYLRDLGDELERETGASETLKEFRDAQNSFRGHADSFRNNVVNFEREAKDTADEVTHSDAATPAEAEAEAESTDDTGDAAAPKKLASDKPPPDRLMSDTSNNAATRAADDSASPQVTHEDSPQDTSTRGQ